MRAIICTALLLAALPALADPAADDAARVERLRAAQAQRQAAQEARQAGWQIVLRQERTCQPLADAVPGASDPAEALARIRRSDPDAGWAPDGEWPASGLPFAQIETSVGTVTLAQNYPACVNLFRVFRW